METQFKNSCTLPAQPSWKVLNFNLWSDKQWQCPYYLHMTLRSPKNTAIGCDTAPNNVSLVQAKEKKKQVKMNRVFGSPYKFSLCSHYIHFSQQYSISLSMSRTLCVLTQILQAGQYHPSKWDSQWNSSMHPTTAKFHRLFHLWICHLQITHTILWHCGPRQHRVDYDVTTGKNLLHSLSVDRTSKESRKVGQSSVFPRTPAWLSDCLLLTLDQAVASHCPRE